MTDLDTFERAARVYADAVGRGVVRLGASGPGAAMLYVRDSSSLKAMREEAGLSVEELRAARQDITDVLTAHAGGASADAFVKIAQEQDDAGQSHSEQDLRRRFDVVAELFAITPLRLHSWNKFTSKNPIFYRLDWEVLEKRADDDYGRPDGKSAPFGLIQLKTVERRGSDAVSETITTFIADSFDLEMLANGLERLRKSLASIESTPDD